MATATAERKKRKAAGAAEDLREQRDGLLGRRDELLAELRLVTALVDPHVHDSPSSTRSERLRAAARRPDLERDLRLCQADLEDAEVALREAVQVERERLRQTFHEKKKPVIARLAKALEAAAEVNAELAAIEDEEVAAVQGWSRSLTAWPELSEATPTTASRLTTWRTFCEAEGLLDEPVEEDDESD